MNTDLAPLPSPTPARPLRPLASATVKRSVCALSTLSALFVSSALWSAAAQAQAEEAPAASGEHAQQPGNEAHPKTHPTPPADAPVASPSAQKVDSLPMPDGDVSNTVVPGEPTDGAGAQSPSTSGTSPVPTAPTPATQSRAADAAPQSEHEAHPETPPTPPAALPGARPSAKEAESPPPTASPANDAPPIPAKTSKPVPIPESGLPAQPRGTPNAPASRPPAAPDTDDDAKQVRHCQVPASLQPPPIKLPGLSGALARNRNDVLVIVLGAEAVNDSRHSLWPGSSTRARTRAQRVPLAQRLQTRLSRDLGELAQQRLKVESMGKPHSTVAEQAALIGKQILPRKPALVVWNLGLSDVSRGQPPGRVARALDKGLAQLRKQRIDTIVVDLPYHPQYEALYRTNDYRQYIRWTMNSHEQPVLRRFDMVDYWDSTGRIDLDSTEPERQAAAGVFIDTCVSYQLSRMIDRAVN